MQTGNIERINQLQDVALKRADKAVMFLDCYDVKVKRCLNKASRDLNDLGKFKTRGNSGEGGNGGMTTDEREAIVTNVQDTWRWVEKLRPKVVKVA